MSYLNGQEGYREQLLSTRSVVKKDNFVLLEVDGLVENRIPGYENCDVSILASPEMGASFADYFVSAHAEAILNSSPAKPASAEMGSRPSCMLCRAR